jgi:hypothetical protein
MSSTTTPHTAAPTGPVRQWDSDGACRCADLRNVWGGRTTHFRSQCHPDEQSATTPERRADR